MTPIIEQPHNKYGKAIIIKNNIVIKSASKSETNNIEILVVNLGKCSTTLIYKPPNKIIVFEEPENFKDNITKIIAGDFQNHSIRWTYTENNNYRTEVEY